MNLRNSRGVTLVELLVTITISFVVMGIVSGVTTQSFRNIEMADQHNTLRQEANLLIAMIRSSQLASINPSQTSTSKYSVSYRRNPTNWELTIGNQLLSNTDYDIELRIEQVVPGETLTLKTLIIDSNNQIGSLEIIKRQPLIVRKIKLIDKKDRSKTFEISTTISRL
jgi:Tfp pilus assembly protein FimT